METSLAEDVKKPTRTLSPDSFFFMSPYRSFTTSGCFRRFSQPAVSGDALNGEFQQLRYLRVLLSGSATAMWNGFRRTPKAA